MTREEFLSMDWNDSHVGYDMQVDNYRTIAYLTLSNKYSDCLCLVTDNEYFPIKNSGCGISTNPSPADVITLLNKRPHINRVVTVIDGLIYDLKPNVMYVNGIDSQVLFDIIPLNIKSKYAFFGAIKGLNYSDIDAYNNQLTRKDVIITRVGTYDEYSYEIEYNEQLLATFTIKTKAIRGSLTHTVYSCDCNTLNNEYFIEICVTDEIRCTSDIKNIPNVILECILEKSKEVLHRKY